MEAQVDHGPGSVQSHVHDMQRAFALAQNLVEDAGHCTHGRMEEQKSVREYWECGAAHRIILCNHDTADLHADCNPLVARDLGAEEDDHDYGRDQSGSGFDELNGSRVS